MNQSVLEAAFVFVVSHLVEVIVALAFLDDQPALGVAELRSVTLAEVLRVVFAAVVDDFVHRLENGLALVGAQAVGIALQHGCPILHHRQAEVVRVHGLRAASTSREGVASLENPSVCGVLEGGRHLTQLSQIYLCFVGSLNQLVLLGLLFELHLAVVGPSHKKAHSCEGGRPRC